MPLFKCGWDLALLLMAGASLADVLQSHREKVEVPFLCFPLHRFSWFLPPLPPSSFSGPPVFCYSPALSVFATRPRSSYLPFLVSLPLRCGHPFPVCCRIPGLVLLFALPGLALILFIGHGILLHTLSPLLLSCFGCKTITKQRESFRPRGSEWVLLVVQKVLLGFMLGLIVTYQSMIFVRAIAL